MRVPAAVAGGVALALFLSAGTARAQGNYRGSPQGGRSALLGGTGVALGRDGSIPFLNPAGLTRVEPGTVSFSTNFFALSHTRYDRFFQPRRQEGGSSLANTPLDAPSYGQNKLDGVPSTLCLFFRLGKKRAPEDPSKHIAAACFGTTERSANDGTALQFNRSSGPYEVSQTQTFNRSFRRFLFGPTYALRYKTKWSFGAALHLVATSYSATTSSSNIVSGDGSSFASTMQSSFSGNSFDLALRVGASYKLDRHLTLGLSAQLPALHLFGRLNATETTTTLDPARGEQTMNSQLGSGSFLAVPPPSVAAGIGWESWPNRVETDLFVFLPLGTAFRSRLDVTSHTVGMSGAAKTSGTSEIVERAHAVIDAAFGVERYLSPSFSLLGGLSTDFSANPPLSATSRFGSVVWSRSSRASLSLGVGSYGGAGELLLGTELSFARGKAYAADSFGTPNDLALVNQTTWTALFVLSGKTSFSHVRQTVDRIRSLTLAP